MRTLFAAIGLLLAMTTTALANPLAPFKGDYRPLLIFTGSPEAPNFRQQFIATSQSINELYERDILRIHVLSDAGQVGLHAKPTPQLAADQLPTAEALRQRFDLGPDDFAVILVGKDGGEKARWSAPVAMAEVYALIDTMPMRQREMREN
ncbi:MAG: DUF4174 domain-containing protein [Alphaproteobacteria bacterium]|nr:DUF4174 domain-containing protein [Alphaproteobacteria bacterium SS10]